MKKVLLIIIVFLCFINVEGTTKTKVKLKSCIDGDTAKFTMNKEVVTVRFLAIDTPEIKHGKNNAEPYGEEASNYTCNQLTNAKNIYLELDNKSDQKDKYDRLLAWVFIDDSLLQEKIIKEGLAKTAYIYDEYKYINVLKSEEKKAKEKKTGIWDDSKNTLEIDYQFLKENYVYIILSILLLIILCLISNKTKKYIKRHIIKKLKKH